MSDSLWGDLGKLEIIKTPVTILKEQAAYLTDATKGVLRGDVNSVNASFSDQLAAVGVLYKKAKDKGRLYYELDVVAPALNDYRYTIVRISHDINLYPVRLDLPDGSILECKGEAQYLRALGEIFNSPHVRSVITSLLSQSGGEVYESQKG